MPTRRNMAGILVLALILSAASSARAADELPVAGRSEPITFEPSKAWFLIIVGHPGDREYEEQFADLANRLSDAACDRLGIDEQQVWIWSGVNKDGSEAVQGSRGPATRDALERDIAALRDLAEQDADLCVIVLGHAHLQGNAVQLNLPGPDVAADEFARWFAGFPCRWSAFFMTTPHSAAFIKPLAESRRVVIAAAADDEDNGTLYPMALVEQLELLGQAGASDAAGNESVTLLDLYLAVARDASARYESEQLIPTEHAQLDDNGDGRGSEVQNQKNAAVAKPPRDGDDAPDGTLSASIQLEFLPAETPSK
jgi:hypothetical protein